MTAKDIHDLENDIRMKINKLENQGHKKNRSAMDRNYSQIESKNE